MTGWAHDVMSRDSGTGVERDAALKRSSVQVTPTSGVPGLTTDHRNSLLVPLNNQNYVSNPNTLP